MVGGCAVYVMCEKNEVINKNSGRQKHMPCKPRHKHG
jgi:hypothetical protein